MPEVSTTFISGNFARTLCASSTPFIATLIAGLKSTTALAKNLLTVEQLEDWRDYIERMARDFLAGRADVDPRDYPETCERCGLQPLCRIQENRAAFEAENEPDASEAADE